MKYTIVFDPPVAFISRIGKICWNISFNNSDGYNWNESDENKIPSKLSELPLFNIYEKSKANIGHLYVLKQTHISSET